MGLRRIFETSSQYHLDLDLDLALDALDMFIRTVYMTTASEDVLSTQAFEYRPSQNNSTSLGARVGIPISSHGR